MADQQPGRRDSKAFPKRESRESLYSIGEHTSAAVAAATSKRMFPRVLSADMPRGEHDGSLAPVIEGFRAG